MQKTWLITTALIVQLEEIIGEKITGIARPCPHGSLHSLQQQKHHIDCKMKFKHADTKLNSYWK